MSDIKTLIDYLNPKKTKGASGAKGHYHLIRIDTTFLNEGQNIDSENVTKVIRKTLPEDGSFTDAYNRIDITYPLYVEVDGAELNYYFKRNQNNVITYVTLEDVLLDNTNESHFNVYDDTNFIAVTLENNHYYHNTQHKIYSVVTVLNEVVVASRRTLKYNPNELGGLQNGVYVIDYKDAEGFTNGIIDNIIRPFIDLDSEYGTNKRKVKLELNPQQGELYWYPEIVYNKGSITLYYDYHPRENDGINIPNTGVRKQPAIKLTFYHPEGFLGFMVVTYFAKGVSPLEISEGSKNRKAKCFISYVRIINTLLDNNSQNNKENIDAILTYLYYVPADFYIKEQTLFKQNKDIKTIGEQFIWKTIGLALQSPLINFETDREDIVLRLLKILKYIQRDENGVIVNKNDSILHKLLTKKTANNKSYLWALYDKLDDVNAIQYYEYLYKLWKNSSYINPANPVYTSTSPLTDKEDDPKNETDKPRLIFPYKTNKLLGFYSSNINAKFNDIGNIIVTPDASNIDEVSRLFLGEDAGKAIKLLAEEQWQEEYHPLQPVYLADPGKDTAVQLNRMSPMLLLKANEDTSFWSNVSTATEYAFDIVTTASGIGNLAKFRHLASITKAVNAANKTNRIKRVYHIYKTAVTATAAAVEITAGTVNALLKITGIKDTEFGKALSEYLFWLELLSLSGELTVAIGKGLQKNAKLLTDDTKVLNKYLDEVVIEDGNATRKLSNSKKLKVVDEIQQLAEGGLDYSARLAKQASKSLDRAPNEIKHFEDVFKSEKYEWGGVYNKRTKFKAQHTSELKDEISWPSYILNNIEACIVTHNHPKGTGLSIADLKFFMSNRLVELRAVGPDGSVFSLRNGNIIDGSNIKFIDFENDLETLSRKIKLIEKKYKLSYQFAVGDTNRIDAKVFNEIFALIKDKVTYTHYIN